MTTFFAYDDAEDFQRGQLITLDGQTWIIIGVRDNGRGLWLTLREYGR